MKNKMRLVEFIVGAVAVIGVVAILLQFLPSYVAIFSAGNATVKSTFVSEQLNDEDTQALKDILSGKWSYIDSPSCGFNEEITVEFGDSVFMPACDGCAIVKHGNKYITLSKYERDKLDDILSKYGILFPIV